MILAILGTPYTMKSVFNKVREMGPSLEAPKYGTCNHRCHLVKSQIQQAPGTRCTRANKAPEIIGPAMDPRQNEIVGSVFFLHALLEFESSISRLLLKTPM